MKENKKIRNARETVFNGITFRSKLEESFYKTLLQAGFEVDYEQVKFIIVEGFIPTIPFYNRSKSRIFRKDMTKVRPVTYTPDFTFSYKDTLFIIEAKGIENDVFPLKRKLFRKYLETLSIPCMYFEVHTKKELLQVIDIIKDYELPSRNRGETVVST